MKKNTILWIASVMLVYFIVFIHTVTSKDYPISGNEVIEGQDFIYKFEKKTYFNSKPEIKIFSEGIRKYNPILEWSNFENFSQSDSLVMGYQNNYFSAFLPINQSYSTLFYRVVVHTKKETKYLPNFSGISLSYVGKVSSSIMGVYYLVLFGGLLLVIKTGLNSITEFSSSKKSAFFILSLFFVYAFAITPLMQSYKLGLFNKYVPYPSDIFLIHPILMFLVWAISIFLMFKVSHSKKIPTFASILTVIIYLFVKS